MSESTHPLDTLTVNPSRREVWNHNFMKWKEFYDQHRHLSMPREYPEHSKLSQWMTYQRHHSKTLTDEQVAMLESIGYNQANPQRIKEDQTWNEKFDKVLQIKQTTGTTKIPAPDRGLAVWFSRQKKLMASNSLIPSRRRRLEEQLGVTVESIVSQKTKHTSEKFTSMWHEQYEKLVEYRNLYGNCRVPRGWKDKRLAVWVYTQRKSYRQSMSGQCSFDPERIAKLEEIGFEWNIHKGLRVGSTINRNDQEEFTPMVKADDDRGCRTVASKDEVEQVAPTRDEVNDIITAVKKNPKQSGEVWAEV